LRTTAQHLDGVCDGVKRDATVPYSTEVEFGVAGATAMPDNFSIFLLNSQGERAKQ
jgi:hypothetical protein